MTVYASVEGKGPTACQIQVPMTPDHARQLAGELMAAARDADRWR
jgi:hypothetical protein